jgi:diaminohydroxyphosphoribosylaminopyrimidine deaminase/5-amino-6-(5-phosphoribosylamino)uracil reductase
MQSASANLPSADRTWMIQALLEARKGEGMTRPNPPVGAVVVRSGRIVGRGYHRIAGGPHAEVYALRAAGDRARGGTLYVTLEPCCTHGRTPPCTDAILAAGIKTVVYAVADSNPAHAGRAQKILRKHGINVRTGGGGIAADELIEPFQKWITTRIPFVTLKLAMSLDGRIADSKGTSKWITSPPARELVQALRKRVDAIMVGSGTACADNPGLTVRDGTRTPYRIVVDSVGRLSPRARVFTDEQADHTIIATTRKCPGPRLAAYQKNGATVMLCRLQNGQVSLSDLMKRLGKIGLLHVLCEGGGELAGALVRKKIVDNLLLFYGPLLLGGSGMPGTGSFGWPLAKAPRLLIRSVHTCGPDVVIKARILK